MVKINPLENPATAQWGRTLTHSDYNKMLKGFMPQQMEDKWYIATDTPDAQGNIVVHICRSWTSNEQYSLSIAAGNPDETEAKEWATIVKISWKVQPRHPDVLVGEEEAQQSATNLCRNLLGCGREN